LANLLAKLPKAERKIKCACLDSPANGDLPVRNAAWPHAKIGRFFRIAVRVVVC
jgi:hypothetical protein